MVAASNRLIDQKSPFTLSGDKTWKFGFWGYDSKNYIEELSSNNQPLAAFPDFAFFEPEVLIKFNGAKAEISGSYDHDELLKNIEATEIVDKGNTVGKIECLTSRDEYIENVSGIRNQIIEGDFYEINYCIAPYAEDSSIDPVSTFESLNEKTRSPFACLVKYNDQYVISGSPERFLKKSGRKLISQPIKGTARRGSTPEEDELLKKLLRENEKELAENMMIVDLVRNDLAKSCQTGTVKVDEFFGIYSFPFWNQMISTVSGMKNETIPESEIIKNAFPMGSMTGAPKIKSMQMIEHYENFRRGMYSGTVGFIDPDGDFDFNVVIRSIIYDSSAGRIHFPVGSAITYDSDPEQEWNECWLKAESMLKALDQAESGSLLQET